MSDNKPLLDSVKQLSKPKFNEKQVASNWNEANSAVGLNALNNIKSTFDAISNQIPGKLEKVCHNRRIKREHPPEAIEIAYVLNNRNILWVISKTYEIYTFNIDNNILTRKF